MLQAHVKGLTGSRRAAARRGPARSMRACLVALLLLQASPVPAAPEPDDASSVAGETSAAESAGTSSPSADAAAPRAAGTPVTLGEAADALPPGAMPATPGEICLVCGQPVGAGDLAILFRGRRVVLHEVACLGHWQADSAHYFASLQPRGALFQEPAVVPSPLRWGWFVLGLYVLTGLVFGAVCGYAAVGRCLSPAGWFFAGFFANLPAFLFLMSRPRGDSSALPAGVPAGLAKVPTTRAPSSCPRCGAAVHPAASRCGECGAALEPSATAETGLV